MTPSLHDAAFLACTGLFGGTFLIEGYHDDRCIFRLLGPLPLWEWRTTSPSLARSAARVAWVGAANFFSVNFFPIKTTLTTALALQIMARALSGLFGGVTWQRLRRHLAASWSRP